MSAHPVGHTARATLNARWAALSPREQRSLRLLGWTLLAVLVYAVAVGPAWRTLRQSEQRRTQLTQQLATMQALQAQAQALQQRTPLSRDEALRTVQSLSQAVGAALQLTVQGDRVSVQLKAVPATTLAQWLQQVRTQAQTLPLEVHLSQDSSTPDPSAIRWQGQLVLGLPSRSPAAKAP